MRRFRFRLESVLEVRRHAERAAAEELGLAHRRMADAQRVLDQARSENLQALALRDGFPAPASLRMTVAEAQSTVVDTRERLLAALRELELREKKVAEAHAAWLRCRERVQGLERIRDRQSAAHQREALASEGRQLDEIALFRAVNASPAFEPL